MTESTIKVGICVCPLSEEETKNGCHEIISTEENEVNISMGEGKGQKSYEVDFEPFYFGSDRSKGKQSTIADVCSCIGGAVLDQAFAGLNTTLFTYGAKNTGKSSLVFGYKNERGIILHTLRGLFSMADEYEQDTSFRCEISFFEICGEVITDLISKRENVKSQEGVAKLKVKDDPVKGTYVDKLSRHIVTDIDEAKHLFSKGVKSRNRLAALDPSSKETSHSIFNITFTQAKLNDGLPMELVSRINIIDLASSDGYTGYLNGFSNIIQLEDDDLNDNEEKRGPLEVLNDVINALATQNYGSINPIRSYGSLNPKRSYGSIHSNSSIPYEDSNLTLLMKDALGGNCETIMLCCISAAEKSLRDTLSSLKYGNLCRHIKNKPKVNEDQNVKLIRELKDEIDSLRKKQQEGSASGKSKDALRKIQRDQELMNRLTGIWEEKWSKAQQMIEDKTLDFTDIGGTGLKLETKEPHFVSLGGGRLSIGVSIIPIKKGFTRVGSGSEGHEVDLLVVGKGIASEHCLIEFDGDIVVLHPKNELVSIDGIPLNEPTRLQQGCMVCIGKNSYFRFNHPKEAALIREQCKSSRFSIAPDGLYPDVQLAIEQRRKEMQERETLRAENKRLLAMEQQYIQALEKLEFEKEHLEHEKSQLKFLQEQQESVANQFDRHVSIQIEELKLHKDEIKRLQIEKEKIADKERDIEKAVSKVSEKLLLKEQLQKVERDRILTEQASLDLEEFEELEQSLNNNISKPQLINTTKAIELESDKQKLALLELDILTEDLEYHDKFQEQREELEKEKLMLARMEKQHTELELTLSQKILRLQQEKEEQLAQIEQEKERLKKLEEQQTEAIKLIELERDKLTTAKQTEEQKLAKEREVIEETETERMRVLQNAVDEQQKEREQIEKEKMHLLDLEEEHKRALEELQREMISQQEKLERERKLELEYIETEQLMLEELEQKQFESARQIEYETQLIRDQVVLEKEQEKKRLAANENFIVELRKQQELALKQAEDERKRMQAKREEEQQQLKDEREKLAKMEDEYRLFSQKLEDEKEELRAIFQKEKDEEIARMKEELSSQSPTSPPSSPCNGKMFSPEIDPQLLLRRRTPEGKTQQIEEERNRLSELKRQAAEKAELQWIEKKREIERREVEEKEFESRKVKLDELKRQQELHAEVERSRILEETEKMKKHEELLKQREKELSELHKERERREELERLLKNERENENLLEKSLIEEKERLSTLERNYAAERSKRLEIEKRLHEEETRNRIIEEDKKKQETRSNGAISTNGTLKRRVPSYTLSLRSGQSSGNAEEINLLHHILAAGHVIDNCPTVKINRYSCRGFLFKMGKSRLKISWKRRWFVFDRKLRAFCYYQDDRKTKSKGVLYFQSIQEVYVDSSIKRSPNPRTTFCIRTPQRTYVLSAPSPIAMSIWLDVLCTGKEGAFSAMTL